MQFEKPNRINIEKAIAEFRSENPDIQGGIIVTSFIFDDPDHTLQYEGHFFSKEPTIKELQEAAGAWFDENLKGTYPEWNESDRWYKASRTMAINIILSHWILVDTAREEFCNPSLVEPNLYLSLSKGKAVTIGYDCSRILTNDNSGNKLIAYKPGRLCIISEATQQCGFIKTPWGNMRKCPKCGKYELKVTSKRQFKDDHYSGISVGCDCGLSFTYENLFKSGGMTTYKQTLIQAMQIWNSLYVGFDDFRLQEYQMQ